MGARIHMTCYIESHDVGGRVKTIEIHPVSIQVAIRVAKDIINTATETLYVNILDKDKQILYTF